MIKIWGEFDKKSFKIKLNIYSNEFEKRVVIIVLAILSASGLLIINDNKNQFCYGYCLLLVLILAFPQMSSIFYRETLKHFLNLRFIRKQYYLENILIILMISSITSIIFSISIMINKIAFHRQQIICFWYKFYSVNFISIIEILILNFAILTVVYMLANLISIICISKGNIYGFATLILMGLLLLDMFFGRKFNISIDFTTYNKSYSLYLIGLLIVGFLEYYIGKKLFMKKDID